MIVLSVLMLPSMVYRHDMGSTEMLLIDVPLFTAATLSVFNFYLISQHEIYPDWKTRLKHLPAVMAVGIGLAINNTKAVLEGMFGESGEFARTPKFGIEGGDSAQSWQQKKYRQTMTIQPFVELAFGIYFTGAVFYALTREIYGTLPFLMLFQFGFLYMGLGSLVEQTSSDDVLIKAPQIASGK
jgi:hypothetical protein